MIYYILIQYEEDNMFRAASRHNRPDKVCVCIGEG